MSEKVTIEMTREHAQVVQDACEMLMRMKLGQVMFPTELMLGGIGCEKYSVQDFCMRRDVANEILRAFLRLTGNKEGDERDGVESMAYEVWGTIRHALWKVDHPNDKYGMSLASQPPLSESGLTMPKCRVEKKEG